MSGSFGFAAASFESESIEDVRLGVLEQTAIRSSWLEFPLDPLLIRRATCSFWKSLSSNGTGRGVVQALSIIQDGRPVMTLRTCSMVYSDHQTRYLISLEVSDVHIPTFRRCKPRVKAPRTALPANFQELAISEYDAEYLSQKDIPVDMARG